MTRYRKSHVAWRGGTLQQDGQVPSDFLLQKYRLWSWYYFILVKNRCNSGHIRRLAVDTKLVWWDDGAVHGATIMLHASRCHNPPKHPLAHLPRDLSPAVDCICWTDHWHINNSSAHWFQAFNSNEWIPLPCWKIFWNQGSYIRTYTICS